MGKKITIPTQEHDPNYSESIRGASFFWEKKLVGYYRRVNIYHFRKHLNLPASDTKLRGNQIGRNAEL
jgi:hypothetical protein